MKNIEHTVIDITTHKPKEEPPVLGDCKPKDFIKFLRHPQFTSGVVFMVVDFADENDSELKRVSIVSLATGEIHCEHPDQLICMAKSVCMNIQF